MEEEITLTRAQLKTAFLAWEQAHRDGRTLAYAEACALPTETCAEACAKYLWDALKSNSGVQP